MKVTVNSKNIEPEVYRIFWNREEFDIRNNKNETLPGSEAEDYWLDRKAEFPENVFYIFRKTKETVCFNVEAAQEIGDELWDVPLQEIVFDSLSQPENDFIPDADEEIKAAKETPLKLGVPGNVKKEDGGGKWFAFTPEKTAEYRFSFEAEDGEWTNYNASLYLYVAQKGGLTRFDSSDGAAYLTCSLTKGKTYYLCAGYATWSNEDGSNYKPYTVTVTQMISGMYAYCDGVQLEKDDAYEDTYVFELDKGERAALKVADENQAPVAGASYQWYEQEYEDAEVKEISGAASAEYNFSNDQYRRLICEITQAGVTEQVRFRPECKNHQLRVIKHPPTCIDPGAVGKVCDYCEYADWGSWGDSSVVGQHAGNWTDVSAATVFSPARQTRKCTLCGKVEIRTVGKKLDAVITTNASSIQLKTKQATKKLKAAVATGDSVISWTSGDKKIASVSGKADGSCTIKAGKKTGTVKITIKTAAGAVKTIKVKVQKNKVTTRSIKKVPKKITIKKGQSYKLAPELQPITSPDKVKYSAADKKVASVSGKGVIKGKKAGKTKITVKAGKTKVTCTVVVKKK